MRQAVATNVARPASFSDVKRAAGDAWEVASEVSSIGSVVETLKDVVKDTVSQVIPQKVRSRVFSVSSDSSSMPPPSRMRHAASVPTKLSEATSSSELLMKADAPEELKSSTSPRRVMSLERLRASEHQGMTHSEASTDLPVARSLRSIQSMTELPRSHVEQVQRQRAQDRNIFPGQ